MSAKIDPINERANAWMHEAHPLPDSSPKSKRAQRREMSALILRLADRMMLDPDELASRIPPDTIRRSKYPMVEVVNEDGSRSFKHDYGIDTGRRALLG